jgi:MFS family permease
MTEVTATCTSVSGLSAPLRRARFAVSVTFLITGAVVGTWAPRLPAIVDRLDLSPSTLGLALVGPTVGALIGMPLAGAVVSLVGSRVVTRIAVVAQCAALTGVSLAPSLPSLVAALVVLGVTNGSVEVSMNTQAVSVERAYGRAIMSTFHGVFSVGALLGSIGTAWAAFAGLSPIRHFAIAALALGVLGVVCSPLLLVDRGHSGHGPRFARPSARLAIFGAIGFCCLVCEGAASDWGAVFLNQERNASQGLAAAGYASFSLAMAIGRFTGGRVTDRLGPTAIGRIGGTLAALGMAVVLAVPSAVTGLVGFALVGLGLSCVLPTMLSLAGRGDDRTAGLAIAAVSTMSYLGLLVGPPIIGGIAGLVGLTGGLVVVVVLCSTVALLSALVNRHHHD